MEEKNLVENWGIQKAVNFIKNNEQLIEIRKSELLFTQKIKDSKSKEQKAEYIYYLLRCKLKKHSIFETKQCKDLYKNLINCFKSVEKQSLKEYKKNKDIVSKSQLDVFYMTVGHYLGSLGKDYKEHNFINAADRAYVDEMDFNKNKLRSNNKYIKFTALKILEITSNYGTSMGRWLLTSLFVTFVFAFCFFVVDFFHKTMLMIDFNTGGTFFDYIYYSIITFTTLGYGEIVPIVFSGKVLASTEVIVGYLMLGVLVNLLGRKH